MGNIIKISVIVITMFAFVLSAMPVLALGSDIGTELGQTTSVIGQTGFGEQQSTAGQSLPTRVGKIIRTVLGLLGVVVVVIVIYAGFLWMTAGGAPETVKKAKDWIINAIIGLAIILSAYAITDFVIQKILQAST